MEAVDVRGRFMWHQLFTRDVPGAKKFYSSVVGWKTQAWPLDPSYTLCKAGDAPAAGIISFNADIPADAPPHWLQYIGVRDVDGTAEAVVRAGGSILKEPADLKGAGRYAVVKDPQGATFAIIDPENARADTPGLPPVGQFSWHELATSDHEAAFAFYSQLFGWDAIVRMDMGPSVGTYLIFGQNGQQRGGMYIKPPDMPGPPNWLPYAHVPSVHAAVEVVTAEGGAIVQPPMQVPGGSHIAVIMDSGGAAFALNSMGSSQMQVQEEELPAKTHKPKAKAKPRAKPKARAAVKAKSKRKVSRTRKKSKAKKKIVKKNSRARKQSKPVRRKK